MPPPFKNIFFCGQFLLCEGHIIKETVLPPLFQLHMKKSEFNKTWTSLYKEDVIISSYPKSNFINDELDFVMRFFI